MDLLDKLKQNKLILKFIKDKNEEIYIRDLNVPEVKFEDVLILIKMGNWLNTMNKYLMTYEIKDYYEKEDISSDEFKNKIFNKTNLTSDEIIDTRLRFGEILRMLGVDYKKTCIISDLSFSSNNNSFNCVITFNNGEEFNYKFIQSTIDEPRKMVVKNDGKKIGQYIYDQNEEQIEKVLVCTFKEKTKEKELY